MNETSRQGGTQMYCPHCLSIQVCTAVPPSYVGLPSGQRWHFPEHKDLQWFRRVRQCTLCDDVFETAEVQVDFLEELVELRGALAAIKQNAEAYIRESQSATQSLTNLSASLEVLRALKAYGATSSVESSEW